MSRRTLLYLLKSKYNNVFNFLNYNLISFALNHFNKVKIKLNLMGSYVHYAHALLPYLT